MQTEERSVTELSDCEIFWDIHVPRILAAGRDTTIPTLDAEAVFRIEGPGGGEWAITVERGVVQSVGRQAPDSPTVTIRLSEDVFLGIVRGDVDHKLAFFTGRIRISGDLPLVLWIANLIPALREAFPFELEKLREELA